MAKNKKTRNISRGLGIILLYILCLAGIFFMPIRNINVVLQMGISGAEDGTEINLVVEEAGEVYVVDAQPVYHEKVEFLLNPEYYSAESFMIMTEDAGQNTAWNSICAYAGKYDTNTDKMIFHETVTAERTETEKGYCLRMSDEITDDLQKSLNNNYQIKIFLGIFVSVVFIFLWAQLFVKQPICKKVIKNGIFCVAAVLTVYLLLYNDLHKDYETVTVQTSQESSQNTGIEMEKPVRQTFDTELENLHSISLNFQIDSEEEIDQNAKFGVSIWETDTEKIVSQKIFSYESVQQSPSIIIEFGKTEVNPNTNLTVEIKHLTGDIPESIRIMTAGGDLKEGQHLYSDDTEISNAVLQLSVEYEKHLAKDLAKFVEIFIALLIIYTIYCNKLPFNNKYAIAVIYVCMLLYCVLQIGYYILYVGHTPDEMRHMAYIAYLEESGKIIPDFSEMEYLTDTNPATFVQGSINQLGHPPFYYHVMRLCAPIEYLGNGEYYIHALRLRVFSALFGMLAIAIVFYIGYRKISKDLPVLHLLYTAIIVNVPMFLYNLSGVNNDTFALLGCSIFFLGFLILSEGNRNYRTYWLIAIGFSLTILSKLTAGLLLIIMSSIYIVWYCIKDKSIKLILCRQFMTTLPVYLLTIVYFLMVYHQIHSFQPSLANLDMEYYQSTAFYVPFQDRTVMDFKDYFFHYWQGFFGTWTGIASHISLLKQGGWLSYDRFFIIIIPFVPVLCFFINKKRVYAKMFVSFYIALICVVLLQFKNAYNGFYFVSGYPGAYQSRYYLCVLPIMAFIIVWLLETAYMSAKKKISVLRDQSRITQGITQILVSVGIIASAFLFYSGFLYFILNYSNLA